MCDSWEFLGQDLEKVVGPFLSSSLFFATILSFHLKPRGFIQLMYLHFTGGAWGFAGTLGIKILLLPWPLEHVFVLESSTGCSVSSRASNSLIGFLFLLPGTDGCGSHSCC